MLFKKLFCNCFLPLSKLFNLTAALLCSSPTSFNDKCPLCIPQKAIDKEYALKF